MDQQHYKSLANSSGSGVTNYGWGVGGMKSSADNYQTYTISVAKSWYVYKRKPKWFGQYPRDRYLGRLRWISSHADGKQHHNTYQRGDLDGLVINAGSEKESDRIAHDLLLTRGYLARYDKGFMRREYPWYLPSHYRLQIKCAQCHMTRGEHERIRSKQYLDLKWKQGMPDWDAHITARESVTCLCAYEPRQDVIEHHIKTGEGLTYA